MRRWKQLGKHPSAARFQPRKPWENGANRLRFGCKEEAHATHESGRCEMGLAHREGESQKCAVAPA